MPWCPKCGNEYRVGITKCAECKVDLVDKNESKSLKPVFFGEQEQVETIKEFLEYNEFENIEIEYDINDMVYVLYVLDSDYSKALKLIKVFLAQELEQVKDDELEIEDSSDYVPTKQYINSSAWAEENKSSAWILLIAGACGIIFVLLGFFGVLPINMGNKYLFYPVMFVFFALFIVLGVISMRNAKIFEVKAKSENTIKVTIKRWVAQEITKDYIDSHIKNINSFSDEELYFKRIELITQIINNKFLNLDQSFIEHLIDEELYDLIFEK